MELVFPFRNLVINTLWSYFEKGKVKEFSDIKTGKAEWNEEYFNNAIERWRSNLPSFENEILQIINTTDQKTIDGYFNDLADQLHELNRCLSKDFFEERIGSWNDEILKRYEETVSKEDQEYAKHENRKKKHLEEYEDWYFGSFILGSYGSAKAEKVRKINYNYYCIESVPDLISYDFIDEYLELVRSLTNDLFEISLKYGIPWHEGKIKSKIEEQFIPKPIVFVEGEHDITFIKKAAELLNKQELLNRIDLRQRGGFKNLDKLWTILKEESWETIPQVKIFLYDCDTNKPNEDFGKHYKRVIPTLPDCVVHKGIENLFPNETINKGIAEKRAFVDFKKTSGIKRGVNYEEIQNEINKDEKKNFCEWVCTNGLPDDFRNFKSIFDLIEELI